jgi:hypothetical protein
MSRLALVGGLVLFAGAAVTQASGGTVSETAKTGRYTITLKVLPAESFTGPNAKMVWDGGAVAVPMTGAVPPNHHLVAFISHDGTPVEKAAVDIRYRRTGVRDATWVELPVARMHVADKGPATTHFGNNVDLAPGSYEAEVRVGGGQPAMFRFALPAAH